jgi:hypothetical protein
MKHQDGKAQAYDKRKEEIGFGLSQDCCDIHRITYLDVQKINAVGALDRIRNGSKTSVLDLGILEHNRGVVNIRDHFFLRTGRHKNGGHNHSDEKSSKYPEDVKHYYNPRVL